MVPFGLKAPLPPQSQRLFHNLTRLISAHYRIPAAGCLDGSAIAALLGGKLGSKANRKIGFPAHRSFLPMEGVKCQTHSSPT
jgi:hypothetical protein